MRNRTLAVVLAVLICLTAATMVAAATAKSAKAAAPKAFDRDAVLDKYWKAPNSTVVGTVNGVAVTKGELLRALWIYSAPQMLTELLNQRMIDEAAKKAGVTLTPEERKTKEMEAVKRMGLKTIPELLKQFKVSKEVFTSTIGRAALAEKMAMKNVKITDAEYAEWIKARHILIRFPENENDQAKKEEVAKAKIDEIMAKLKAGGDFAKLADEYSEDPSNTGEDGVKKGGDLGWFTKGRMVQEFEKAAFDLKVGQVSEPVKTMYGYHIIKLEGLGKDATPAEKAEIKKQILERKVPMEVQRWRSDIQGKAKIDNKLQEPAPKEPKPVMRPQAPPRMAPPSPPPAANTPPPPPPPASNTPPPPPPPSN